MPTSDITITVMPSAESPYCADLLASNLNDSEGDEKWPCISTEVRFPEALSNVPVYKMENTVLLFPLASIL